MNRIDPSGEFDVVSVLAVMSLVTIIALQAISILGIVAVDRIEFAKGISRARRYLHEDHCNVFLAWSRAVEERKAIGWEARTSEGKELRIAENYLWSYQVVAEKFFIFASTSYIAQITVAVPLWQVLRFIQNRLQFELQSPASLAAVSAGERGAADATHDICEDGKNCICDGTCQ